MSNLSPDEKEAAVLRVAAIEEESISIARDPNRIVEFYQLFLELNELYLKLGSISKSESAQWAKELRGYIAEYEAAQNRGAAIGRELTPAEQLLEELSNRLVVRQGTITPDFDELYRRKAELERRHDRP